MYPGEAANFAVVETASGVPVTPAVAMLGTLCAATGDFIVRYMAGAVGDQLAVSYKGSNVNPPLMTSVDCMYGHSHTIHHPCARFVTFHWFNHLSNDILRY